MSYQRGYLDSPSSSSPPPSPWRTRAEQFRHRPVRLRQAALVLAGLAFICTFALLSRQSHADYDVVDDHHKYQPSAPHLQDGHEHRVHHGAGRPPQIVEDHPFSESDLEDTRVDTVAPATQPIVFSLIMFSEDSAVEGAVLMKSILMYSSKPVQFHIICDDGARAYLERRLRLIERPARDIFVRFYLLSLDDMRARIEREGAIVTDHSAGTPGLMKLFIHEILPESVERTIFIDTDALFITDPALLWDRFGDFAPQTALAMPSHPDHSSVEWHNANRICSCIMLLDLARLRALRLMDSSAYRDAAASPALAPAAFRALFGAPGEDGKYRDVKLGDQGYWWAIVSQNPVLFEHLSYDWEMSSCLMDMYGTGLGDDARGVEEETRRQVHTDATPHEGKAVLPKMLHFNCLDGTPHYFEWAGWADPQNNLAQRWHPAVQYHVGFKWIWLNAHKSLGSLTIEREEKIVFADELFAARQGRVPEGAEFV